MLALACSACTPCQNNSSRPALQTAGWLYREQAVVSRVALIACRRWPRLAARAAPAAAADYPPPGLLAGATTVSHMSAIVSSSATSDGAFRPPSCGSRLASAGPLAIAECP